MLKFILFLLFFSISQISFGSFETTPTEARSRASGNSAVAIPLDNTAVHINPSHLPKFEKFSVSGTFSPLLTGLENGGIISFFANGVIPLKKAGSLGASVNGYLVNMEIDGASAPIYSEFQGALGYGISIGEKFHIGTTLLLQKWSPGQDLESEIETPLSFNVHLGLTYDISENFHIGLVGGNLTGMKINSVSDLQTEHVPRFFRLGVGFKNDLLTVQADAGYRVEVESFDFRIGGEFFVIKQKLWVGAGGEFLNGFNGINPSIGVGLLLSLFSINYAITYPVSVGGFGDHVFTVQVTF